MNNKIFIRAYKPSDAQHLVSIYYNTIHHINIKDYSEEQVEAWAPTSSLELSVWFKKWKTIPPLVASIDGIVVGFVELESSGHIDCFYVHHKFQGRGIGTSLMKEVFKTANHLNLKKVFAEVSITAKPFFEAKGFKVIQQQEVSIRTVKLVNFVMEKFNP